MTTTSKFKIGDKVRIKQGLTGFNTGISDKDLSKIYENNINTITNIETLIDGGILYRIENLCQEKLKRNLSLHIQKSKTMKLRMDENLTSYFCFSCYSNNTTFDFYCQSF